MKFDSESMDRLRFPPPPPIASTPLSPALRCRSYNQLSVMSLDSDGRFDPGALEGIMRGNALPLLHRDR